MALFAVRGMTTQAFRSGGQRKHALPDIGTDPTDAPLARPGPRRSIGAPERRLHLAIVQQAIDDWQKFRGLPDPRSRALADDARRYLAATDYDWPFSFANWCEDVGEDIAAVRRALLGPVERPPRHGAPAALARCVAETHERPVGRNPALEGDLLDQMPSALEEHDRADVELERAHPHAPRNSRHAAANVSSASANVSSASYSFASARSRTGSRGGTVSV